MQLLSTQAILLVASISVAVPIIARLIASPFILFLLSPLLLILIILIFLASNILIAYALDIFFPSPPTPTNRLITAARPLAFSTPAAWQAVLTRSQWSSNTSPDLALLYPEYPALSSALNEVISLIIRDFVQVWYKEISDSEAFPTAVATTIHGTLKSILSRVENLDVPSLVVRRILPAITTHVEQFRKSEMALRGAALERHLTQSDELDLLLASRYAAQGQQGKLHPAVANLSSMVTKESEEAHLRQLIGKVLPFVLPENEANSPVVRVVAREIVACAVLFPVMEMFSDPDFWNRALDEAAGAAIRQQKLISKVRNILEAQSPLTGHARFPSGRSRTEDITSRTGTRHFEAFLRSISKTDSLLDARRLKNDVVGEIRRTRVLLANHEKDEWINGERTEDIVAYLDRLYTAKRKAEKRIAILGGAVDDSRQSLYIDTTPGHQSASRHSLRDVLSNPNSLSYFMEFMDRRNRSLYVQFWLTVESFKNPLESVESGSDDDDEETIDQPGVVLPSSSTIVEDMSMIHELYFNSPSPLLSVISQKHVETIRSFVLESSVITPSREKKVRKSVLLAQKQVERDMEEDFEEFERSELWFKAVRDLEPKNRGSNKPANSNQPLSGYPETSPLVSPGILHNSVELQKPKVHPTFTLPLHAEATSRGDSQDALFGSPSPPPTRTPSNLEFLISSSDSNTNQSRAPLFADPEDQVPTPDDAQSHRIEAIQAALTDIIANERRYSERPRSISSESDLAQSITISAPVNERKRGAPMFNDVEDEEDRDDEPQGSDTTGSGFQLAMPGDLQLSHDISRLGDQIMKLESQATILEALMRKAELTGDAQELRLLNKSKSAMARELRELTFQKAQYEQQESENKLLPDRTRVAIVNTALGDEDGKQVVKYLVEVQQLASDGSFASGWAVARRYNDFFTMHQRLKERYVAVRNLDFPGKRLVTSMSSSFVDQRKIALEKYLQSLICIPLVCESEELRAFLSRQSSGVADPSPKSSNPASFPGQGIVRTVYRTVAESIDDMFFGPSMLDIMIQRLTRQVAEFAGIVGSGINDEDLIAQALKSSGAGSAERTLMQLPGNLKPLEGESSLSSFSAPISDLILAVFELEKKNNWLRKQAIVIILQQVLGDTIERKLREVVKQYTDEPHFLKYLESFRSNLWPGGQLKSPTVPRSLEERMRTRDEANRKLSSLMPDLAANMIGRSNARRGARRIFAVLQNRRLNQHIAYTVVDEVISALFPETT